MRIAAHLCHRVRLFLQNLAFTAVHSEVMRTLVLQRVALER